MLLALVGCASGPNADPRDPLEPFNRGVMRFNDGIDAALLKPVATAYKEGVPPLVRTGVSNFFGLENSLGRAFPGGFDPQNMVGLEGQSSAAGSGSVNRAERVNLTIAAVVTDVLSNGNLIIKGEKKEDKEEKRKGYHLSERHYGAFERMFNLPKGVDADKIEASFSKGVLSISLPKKPEAMKADKVVPVKGE